MKVKIIGSKLCEDTREALKKLEVMAADYEFVDIMESMDNLSMFLGIRDTDENYIPIKNFEQNIRLLYLKAHQKLFGFLQKLSGATFGG